MITDMLEITCWNCNNTYVVKFSPEGYAEWQGGELIQEALPELSDGERELMISSTCDTCWDELFGDFEEKEIEDE